MNFKRNFNIKKGEFIIYAMALMLVTAGYFNFINFGNLQSKETTSEDVEQNFPEFANVGDAVLVSNNEVEDNKETNSEEKNITNEDYYVSSKLDREKMYAEMIANYEKVLNNSNTSEVQKSIISEEIKKINNTKNAIMICENLILTKGFKQCIILVNEKNVDIVVNIENGLKKEDVAKIQNIVSRELDTDIKNIHITEK